jgi:hypothetical protein
LHKLLQYATTIRLAPKCNTCGKKPKGVRMNGEYMGIRNPYFIMSHECAKGKFDGGYHYSKYDAIAEFWYPWQNI